MRERSEAMLVDGALAGGCVSVGVQGSKPWLTGGSIDGRKRGPLCVPGRLSHSISGRRRVFETDVPQWTHRWLPDKPRRRCLLRAVSREANLWAEYRESEMRQVQMPRFTCKHPCGP